MFDFLKKKIGGLVNAITGKVSESAEKAEAVAVEMPAKKIEAKGRAVSAEKIKAVEVQEKKVEASVSEKFKPALSFGSKLKGLIFGEVEISEADIGGTLKEFELSLLEADVAYEVAESIVEEIKRGIIGKKVRKGEIENAVRAALGNALLSVMVGKRIDIAVMASAKAEKPFVIVFFGPNGAGKTTTIAKMALILKNAGIAPVIALADTWRAASQEQGQMWADRLGVKAIGGAYGADPASIGWNAIAHAKSKGAGAVLIDTAGRQETSKNLMDELKKIVRITKPDLKIFVGESMAGNAIVEQVKEFNEKIGLDGVILTKLDCDAKGGTVLSIAKTSGVPIVYFGTGQGEGDIEEFDAQKIVRRMMT